MALLTSACVPFRYYGRDLKKRHTPKCEDCQDAAPAMGLAGEDAVGPRWCAVGSQTWARGVKFRGARAGAVGRAGRGRPTRARLPHRQPAVCVFVRHPGLTLKMPAWVFCVSWCPDFEFRGTCSKVRGLRGRPRRMHTDEEAQVRGVIGPPPPPPCYPASPAVRHPLSTPLARAGSKCGLSSNTMALLTSDRRGQRTHSQTVLRTRCRAGRKLLI